jgi:hypothetical protein
MFARWAENFGLMKKIKESGSVERTSRRKEKERKERISKNH